MSGKQKKRRPLQYYTILLHRYLGYFFAGTTIVYAISGFAVNHMEDWNPNYSISHTKQQVPPFADPESVTPEEGQDLLSQFKLDTPFDPEHVFYPEDDVIEVLVTAQDKITLRVQEGSWEADLAQTRRRPGLHLFNFLHLNSAKKLWTIYADLYAIALLLLAITGLWMKKGKKGLLGEAGIWTLTGMVAPLALIWLYYIGQ